MNPKAQASNTREVDTCVRTLLLVGKATTKSEIIAGLMCFPLHHKAPEWQILSHQMNQKEQQQRDTHLYVLIGKPNQAKVRRQRTIHGLHPSRTDKNDSDHFCALNAVKSILTIVNARKRATGKTPKVYVPFNTRPPSVYFAISPILPCTVNCMPKTVNLKTARMRSNKILDFPGVASDRL